MFLLIDLFVCFYWLICIQTSLIALSWTSTSRPSLFKAVNTSRVRLDRSISELLDDDNHFSRSNYNTNTEITINSLQSQCHAIQHVTQYYHTLVSREKARSLSDICMTSWYMAVNRDGLSLGQKNGTRSIVIDVCSRIVNNNRSVCAPLLRINSWKKKTKM